MKQKTQNLNLNEVITAATETRSMFCKLPTEVRLLIYGFVLVEDNAIDIESWKRAHKLGGPRLVREGHSRESIKAGKVEISKGQWIPAPPSRPSLLLVSRQIYLEAVTVLYGRNQFSLKTTTVLKKFIESIGANIKYVRYVEIKLDGWIPATGKASLNALAAATQLQRLRLMCYHCRKEHRNHLSKRDLCQLVNVAKALLHSLHSRYKLHSLRGNVLDIVKFRDDSETPSLYVICPQRWDGHQG